MNQQQRDLYEATLDSLTRHPDQWVSDGHYRVDHEASGVAVWIANSYYGTQISVDRTEVLGGVTGWSTFFGPMIPWRRKIRKAALAIGNPKAENVRAAITMLVGAA